MSLTCIACKVLFSVPALHHEHYKSDWHRYNLKRKIAELSPVTREEFEERAAAFQKSTAIPDKKVTLRCVSCNKIFSSKNSLVNHLKSKKHLEIEAGRKKNSEISVESPKHEVATAISPAIDKNASKLTGETVCKDFEEDSDGEWTDDDEAEWESYDEDENPEKIVVDTNDCLFCNYQSDSTEDNVSHMTKAHSFYIPDIEYLSDVDGLIACLAAKIHLGRICLWCHGKGKGFKSIKSAKQHMIDKGHCKMLYEGNVLVDYADFYDYSERDLGEEFIDENAIEELLENSDFELVLPSGATLGHRSLALYYKQNLKPASSDNEKKVKKILQQYRALGYTGATGPAAVKVARDINYIKRIKSRYDLKLGIKQNKLQPHFRPQVMF